MEYYIADGSGTPPPSPAHHILSDSEYNLQIFDQLASEDLRSFDMQGMAMVLCDQTSPNNSCKGSDLANTIQLPVCGQSKQGLQQWSSEDTSVHSKIEWMNTSTQSLELHSGQYDYLSSSLSQLNSRLVTGESHVPVDRELNTSPSMWILPSMCSSQESLLSCDPLTNPQYSLSYNLSDNKIPYEAVSPSYMPSTQIREGYYLKEKSGIAQQISFAELHALPQEQCMPFEYQPELAFSEKSVPIGFALNYRQVKGWDSHQRCAFVAAVPMLAIQEGGMDPHPRHIADHRRRDSTIIPETNSPESGPSRQQSIDDKNPWFPLISSFQPQELGHCYVDSNPKRAYLRAKARLRASEIAKRKQKFTKTTNKSYMTKRFEQ